MKICQYHLGCSTEHTVYEAELIGIILALFLLMNLYCQMCNTIVIGLNNQASIRALANQDSKPAQYLLDHIHTTVENLQEKQDKIQNTSKFREAHRNKHTLVVCNRGVINLNIQWVPGHMDFALNDKADQHTKEAAKGLLSPSSELLKSLRKPLPVSVSTLWQELKSKIQKCWACQWRTSPQYHQMRALDKMMPSKKWLKLAASLSCSQASIILQLHTGHIGLNKFLHWIKWADTPFCPSGNNDSIETINHFLFKCHHYWQEQHILQTKLHQDASNASYLLSNPATTLPLLKYIHATSQLKKTFGVVYSED